jgi:hypothetical protein
MDRYWQVTTEDTTRVQSTTVKTEFDVNMTSAWMICIKQIMVTSVADTVSVNIWIWNMPTFFLKQSKITVYTITFSGMWRPCSKVQVSKKPTGSFFRVSEPTTSKKKRVKRDLYSRDTSTRLYGVTSENIALFIVTTVKTSNPKHWKQLICYRSVRRGINSRWCHWIFQLT